MEKRIPRVRLRADSRNSEAERSRRLDYFFGPPLLLPGEDKKPYEQLIEKLLVAVQPVDIIDHIFIRDLAVWESEILRLRRLKLGLIKMYQDKALRHFLDGEIDFDEEEFVSGLEAVLTEGGKDIDSAKELADRVNRNEPAAVDKCYEFLRQIGRTSFIDNQEYQNERVEKLARGYARGQQTATTEVNRLLAEKGMTLHDLIAGSLSEWIYEVEHLDELIISAEARRNSSLYEIERRRALLGYGLQRKIREIEAEDLRAIEGGSSTGKTAA